MTVVSKGQTFSCKSSINRNDKVVAKAQTLVIKDRRVTVEYIPEGQNITHEYFLEINGHHRDVI